MSVHCIAIGYADATGVYLRTGDGYQAQTEQPADIDPCPCGKPNCDRGEWHELMDVDPRDNYLSWRESVEVSF
jgi:hypothetical protein